jgi:hypothetical protein
VRNNRMSVARQRSCKHMLWTIEDGIFRGSVQSGYKKCLAEQE